MARPDAAAAVRVVHITTVHARRDTRIMEKQTATLAAAGYDTWLLVGDGLGDESLQGVKVRDIGARPATRLGRMLQQPLHAWRAARALRAAIYHFHDPELLPLGLALRATGAAVVYDSHEDVPRDILSKSWIRPALRYAISRGFEVFENFAARHLSAVVGATPHIAERFAPIARRSVDINNYPLQAMAMTSEGAATMARDPRTVCYVGTIEPIRGIFEMIQALEHVDARLVLAGPWDRPETEARARALPGWAKVSYRGKVTRDEAWRIMAGASLGFVVLHPAPNHIEAQPTKMFEYMAAGLPVIASHFPLWSRIVRDSGAGVCVDPKDPVALGRAIAQMLADPASLREMGRRGREAVATRYRWAPEGEKLCRLYAELVGAGQGAPVAAAKPQK